MHSPTRCVVLCSYEISLPAGYYLVTGTATGFDTIRSNVTVPGNLTDLSTTVATLRMRETPILAF